MVVSTILNLIFIPVLYVILKTVLERFSPRKEGNEPPPLPADADC